MTPSPTTDAQAIGASLTGDAAAFVEVFDRHYAFLHRFISARAGWGIAEDLTSEVFLVAYRRRSAYDQAIDDARPWLLGIALNVLRRHARGRHGLERLIGRLRPETPADTTGDLDTRLDARAEARRLNAALDALRAQERDAFLLMAWGELTYEQIAETLGVPVGTVRSRISRARSRLQDRLGGHEPATDTAPEASA